MRSWLWWLWAVSLGALVVVGCSPAGASTWKSTQPVVLTQATGSTVVATPGAVYGTGSSLLNDLLIGRTYTPMGGVTAGSVLLTELLTKPLKPSPLSPDFTVKAKRTVPWAAIAAGVGRASPYIATALVIKEIWDAVRCREGFGGGPECDEGQPEIPRTTWTAPGGAFNCIGRTVTVTERHGRTALEAGTSWVQGAAAQCGYINYGPVTISPGGVVSMPATETWGQPRSVQVIPTSATAPGCPDVVVNGVTLTPVKDADGKCATTIYEPKTPEQVTEKVEQHGPKLKAPAALAELDAAGIPVSHPSPQFEVPPVVQGGREVITKPDGGKIVRDEEFPMEATPDGYRWRLRSTETVYPPGVEIPPQGSSPTEPSTVIDRPASSVELETCGLPGKPPCKIDETGTPEWDKNDPEADADAAISDWKDCLLSPSTCVPALPSLNWSFEFPSTCAPIALPQFSELGFSELDICQWQAPIHDVMSMIWAAAGLFGAISMIGRDSAGGS